MKNFKSRQVKVFVSSTFLGMQDEREVLTREIFPEIHQRCKARKLTLTEIDLRWGASEQDNPDDAVLTCLERVSESTYMLGILGERYGSALTPRQIEVTRQRFPRVKEYAERSATELEILHALFDMTSGQAWQDEEMIQALFYFRDENYGKMMPKNVRENYTDTAENRHKQVNFKQRIRTWHYPVTTYQKPDDLVELITEQLWALIEADFPEDDIPSDRTLEEAEHEILPIHCSRFIFVGRRILSV